MSKVQGKETLPMSGKALIPVLDDRLLLIASMVREDAVVLDVGTDHAYIPIYLIKSGVCKRAVASDVNAKPLRCAEENARHFKVEDSIAFCLGDGIRDAHPERYGVTDIVIAGMGGELIASIIDESDYAKRRGVRLILQPMSRAQELRAYLAAAGYRTEYEKLCRAGGKFYTCIVAEYDGKRRQLPPLRLEIGTIEPDDADPLVNGFLESTADRLKRKLEGMKKGGLSTEREEELLREIREIAAARGYFIE